METTITKESLEKELGFEIKDFKVKIENGIVNIYVEKVQSMGVVENKITILKKRDIINEQNNTI